MTLTIRKIEQELLAAGHSVLILTTKSGDLRQTHMDGTHPNRQVLFIDNSIPIPFLEGYHIGYSLSRDVRQQLDQFEPTIMHVTVPDNLCLHLIQYARDREIPLMGTYHSNIPEYMAHYPGFHWLKPLLGQFFLHQYGFLQALYVPTPYIHTFLSNTYNMNKATSLKIWGRGIDLQQFSPQHRSLKFRHSLGIQDDDVVICWVGRMVPEKRTDIFASVINRLADHNVNVHVLVVGRGPSEVDFQDLPNCTFCGWLYGHALSVAYASCDVFLFPSAVETFGNVTLEAAASGLPLVVEGGCSGHLVKHGVNGFCCTDEESFYQATFQLCVDSDLRKSASRASRQHSLQFEKSIIVKTMLDNYQAVTEEFYVEYGGRHENRDLVYLSQENAFSSGSHPRPFLFVVVEAIVFSIFRTMTWLWYLFVSFHGIVIARLVMMIRGRRNACTTERAVSSSRKKLPSPPRKPVSRVDTFALSLMEKGGESDEDDTASMTCSMSDATSLTSVSSTDSDIVSTVAIANTSMTMATTPSVAPPPPLSLSAIIDSPIVTGLSAAIIRLIAWQCRIESAIRNSYKCLCQKQRVVRKRKNSNMPVPAALLRNRSGGSDCSDDSGVRADEVLTRRPRRSPVSNHNSGESSLPL